MKLSLRLIGVLFLPLVLTACSKSQDAGDSRFVGVLSESETRALPLKVTDARGLPIAGAQVLIGDGLNQPLPLILSRPMSRGFFRRRQVGLRLRL